ncbi:MAG: flagellar assembly peptidoglycan hydrolase FlgJ [Shewanella sp.]
MEKLSSSSHFLDLGSLDNLRAQAQKDEQGALKEVAKQFEGIFVQMLMKSMREANAAFESDSPMNSQYTKFYEQMHDQQMSIELSSQGGLGLADVMVKQLSPKAPPKPSATRLATDNNVMLHQPVSHASTPSIQPDAMQPNTLAALAAKQPLSVAQQCAPSSTNADTHADTHADPNDVTVLFFDAMQSLQRPEPRQSPAITLLDNVLSGRVLPSVAKAATSQQINSQADFVRVLYPHAVKAAKAMGTEPELLLAQSALETGWGQKMVKGHNGQPSYNLFNIKADRRWDGNKAQVSTLEYEQGIAVRQNANFRVYENFEQSFSDLADFIATNDRYKHARTQADKPAEFIRSLQKAGYATDPQYANKVLNVLKTIKSDFAEFLVKEAQ